jgi:tRNA nucleotidyltransferase (CCA-adding enzyme)
MARAFRDNIKDISAERIYDELKKILVSDTKYSFSNPNGHYDGLKLLDKIGVLEILFPELTKGKGMEQRKDYHKYDVFGHILKVVYYANPKVRLGALLHDIGKAKAMEEFGKYHGHADIGVGIAKQILQRLKVDNKTTSETLFLIKYHMKDMDCLESKNKIKRFMVENQAYVDSLLMLKQADYMGSMDKKDVCPTVIKWNKILEEMNKDGTPFCLKDLRISANDLINIGFRGKEIGNELNKLFSLCVIDPTKNDHVKLLKISIQDYEKGKK